MSGMYDEPQVSDINPEAFKAFPASVRGPGYTPTPRGAVAQRNAAEQHAREMQVEIEMIKLLRQDVIHCYRKEGVNHYANCRKVVDTYVKAISGIDIGARK
jgi:hypothetical protein